MADDLIGMNYDPKKVRAFEQLINSALKRGPLRDKEYFKTDEARAAMEGVEQYRGDAPRPFCDALEMPMDKTFTYAELVARLYKWIIDKSERLPPFDPKED